MCGICGVINLNNYTSSAQLESSKHTIAGMLAAMSNRGPDDEGTYFNKGIAFGHRRLSIIDVSSAGHQPMIIDNVVLVFNGCIYNYEELRLDLTALGQQFFSTSDTEVILRAYLVWGSAAVAKFDGMFAFAIYDGNKQKLLLARDRIGIKPLYFAFVNDNLLFASTTQAILADSSVPKSLNPIGIQQMFRLHGVVSPPHTVLTHVKKFKQGHLIELDLGSNVAKAKAAFAQPQAFWQINSLQVEQETTHFSIQDWERYTEEILWQAVKKRLEAADVNVGVLLSGGLDSSLITAIAAKEVNTLDTYSIGFEDNEGEQGSEFDLSDSVVELYETKHHKFKISNSLVLARLPELFTKLSEPMLAQDAIGFFLLSEQVAKNNKVVLSGQGADEVFGGYFWYKQMHESKIDSEYKRYSKYYLDRSFNELQEFINPEFLQDANGVLIDHTKNFLKTEFAKMPANSFINKVFGFDSCNLVTEDPVRRVDNMTMAWGLESRVPFLDIDLVELAWYMPHELKLAQGGKGILRSIAKKFLPKKIISKPKGYFPMPALKYVKNNFLEMMRDVLNSKKCLDRGIYNTEYIKNLIDNPLTNFTAIKGSKLWHAAQFELWLQHNDI